MSAFGRSPSQLSTVLDGFPLLVLSNHSNRLFAVVWNVETRVLESGKVMFESEAVFRPWKWHFISIVVVEVDSFLVVCV